VDEQRRTVAEVEELVLAAALDAHDPRPAETSGGPRREPAPLGGVMRADGDDCAAGEPPAELPHGELDLGEFRHAAFPD
jgi:hypothetical protein